MQTELITLYVCNDKILRLLLNKTILYNITVNNCLWSTYMVVTYSLTILLSYTEKFHQKFILTIQLSMKNVNNTKKNLNIKSINKMNKIS